MVVVLSSDFVVPSRGRLDAPLDVLRAVPMGVGGASKIDVMFLTDGWTDFFDAYFFSLTRPEQAGWPPYLYQRNFSVSPIAKAAQVKKV